MMHTEYGFGVSATHDIVIAFWQIFKDMTQPLKKKLLKFATSCSSPPMLGFKVNRFPRKIQIAPRVFLNPPFC